MLSFFFCKLKSDLFFCSHKEMISVHYEMNPFTSVAVLSPYMFSPYMTSISWEEKKDRHSGEDEYLTHKNGLQPQQLLVYLEPLPLYFLPTYSFLHLWKLQVCVWARARTCVELWHQFPYHTLYEIRKVCWTWAFYDVGIMVHHVSLWPFLKWEFSSVWTNLIFKERTR